MSLLECTGEIFKEKSYRQAVKGTAPAAPTRGCQALPGEVPGLEAAFAQAQTAPSLAEGRRARHSGSGLREGELLAAPCAPPLPRQRAPFSPALLPCASREGDSSRQDRGPSPHQVLPSLPACLFFGPYLQSKREKLDDRALLLPRAGEGAHRGCAGT